MMTLEDFKAARNVLSGVITNTGLVPSTALSKASGNNVYLKPENMQVTGAYKIRGAYFKLSTLSEEEKARGLVTASAGNHAQGVAYAAQAAGVKATIVMPTTTPLVKVNNTKDYGAEVVLHGETFDDAAALAQQLVEERGLTYVPPFNDLAVATGQGTIAYEIFQSLPDVDVILVPIGGGGLAAGVSTLAKLLNPNVKVIGVEPTGAASMKASVEAGHVVTLDHVETIADGVAVKTPGDLIFPYIQQNIDDIITIDDVELVDAFLDMIEKHKMIVENSGLLPIAALSHLDCRGKNVVCVLSGGNMDVITVASLVQHGLINRGRVFTFSVQLPDRPGELLRVAEIISRENGNIIKLEHNQFVNINRQSGVELRVTLEAFGHTHKRTILTAMRSAGYDAREVNTGDFYD
ncbi:threonine ammonia-lyase [Pseudoflavonifractor intestinihominis]|uniref:L-threonine dehydratase catabolic TdcB n=1 Tax=Pseudoflavonifractor intestinihominis TaxID=3133171 RepID=A0ABV1EDY3_9FIRM|nr:threonine ammonia-lyase [uncultured Pseudoflavonifractor sp.]